MKKSTLLIILSFIGVNILSAQTEVSLNIFHKLGDQNFELYTETENNINHAFEVKRLEYYISKISMIHDGGLETAVDDVYILADASEATNISLGNFDVTNLEAIRFFIGVDSSHNHLDPASFPTTHPLYPKLPSMHWGWQAGYRFIAFEGKSGPILNQDCQMHALGDQNYFQTEILVNFVADNGSLIINLDADYNRALEDIELNGGVYSHGFDAEALKTLENFRDYVFSQSTGVVALNELSELEIFEVYPNPSYGNSTIEMSLESGHDYEVKVQTILGSTIQSFKPENTDALIDLDLANEGIYFISLLRNKEVVALKKLVVNK